MQESSKIERTQYMDCCDWDQCIKCGECLIKCPVLKMDKEKAIFEINQLLKGEKAPTVFKNCTLCFNCNQYCPIEGLRPHELILQRIIENRNGKVKKVLPYMINGMPSGSFFQDLYAKMTSEEKDILRNWEEIPAKSKDILFIGCIGRLSCYDIENSKVLESLPKFSPSDICCGELAYRLVDWQSFSDVIERTMNRFEKLNIERMVCYCASCFNFFSSILPKVYGKKLNFKLISMYEWLLERIESGKLKLENPLDYKVAISESCYVSELGPMFAENLRKIYEEAGAEVVELENHGTENISCGFCSLGRSNIKVRNSIFTAHKKKYKQLKKSEAKMLALNCPGCRISLGLSLHNASKKLRYMAEDLLYAFGDDVTKPLNKRMGTLAGILIKRIFKLFKYDKYPLPRIPVEGPIYSWKDK